MVQIIAMNGPTNHLSQQMQMYCCFFVLARLYFPLRKKCKLPLNSQRAPKYSFSESYDGDK
eukprot:6198716-Pleurochrysis_carterae.AAC.5